MNAGAASRRQVGLRGVGLVVSLLAGSAALVHEVDRHYPVSRWLLWSYVEYWVLGVALTFACWAAGDAVVRRVVRGLPASERIVLALSAGLLVFFLGMFLGGLLGLYGRVFFVFLPLSMALSGGPGFARFLRRLVKHTRGVGRRRSPTRMAVLATVFGLGGVGMVYFSILTPENIAYDAHWYHLPIAEHYAAQGGVSAFVEGWYPGALPHLASFVYTWAFLLPGSDLFDRVELSAHLEFFVFLWTLGSIPVLVRACARRALVRLRGGGSGQRPRPSGLSSWAALFLFPGVFLYDSSLSGAADHVNAFWAVPIMLALLRFLRGPSARQGAFLAVPMSGALLTKYQASALVALPAVAVVFAVLWVMVRGKRATVSRGSAMGGAAALGAGGLVLTAPHWLKNWVWYGDPIYPFLRRHLHVHPWTVDAGPLFDQMFVGQDAWLPRGTPSQKLVETLTALPTFSFRPHDWPAMHGIVPVFGSLFTLLILPLPFFRRASRIWLVALAAHVGVFVWYWTFHQDRYLQCLVPWMATVVGAVCALVWQLGIAPRVSLALLVAFQVVWGGDVYFIPGHAMLHGTPARAAVQLMSSGFRKEWDTRRNIYGSLPVLARDLPPSGKVLIHDSHMHLGLGRPSVSDWGPWQGGISYGRKVSPAAIYDQLRGYGVTHIFWNENHQHDSLAGDFSFYTFVSEYTRPGRSSGIKVAIMPTARPPARQWLEELAAVYLCPGQYAAGQYRLGDLVVSGVGAGTYPEPRRTALDQADVDDILRTSNFLALDKTCHAEIVAPGYKLIQARGRTGLWIRMVPIQP